jgi:hypothetical protein
VSKEAHRRTGRSKRNGGSLRAVSTDRAGTDSRARYLVPGTFLERYYTVRHPWCIV